LGGTSFATMGDPRCSGESLPLGLFIQFVGDDAGDAGER
jgi:hypothetical protein